MSWPWLLFPVAVLLGLLSWRLLPIYDRTGSAVLWWLGFGSATLGAALCIVTPVLIAGAA